MVCISFIIIHDCAHVLLCAAQVTLFGESAGGESVEFHLLSEASKPYFNRAIVQSTPNYPYPDKQDANTVTDLIVTQFILRSKCGILQRGIDCLR